MIARTLALLPLALGALAVASPAQATEGLEWQWSTDTARTYHLIGQIQFPEFLWLRAFNNKEARATQAYMDLVMTCRGVEPAGKKAWEVQCTLSDVALQAVAVPGDKGRLDPILQEWDERLTGAALEVLWRNDGQIKDLSYVDMNRRNRRDGENLEFIRQLLLRGFSAYDLELPRKGDDGGEGQWTQKAPLALTFPSFRGTVGTVEVTHQIQGTRGHQYKIASAGKGTVADAGSTAEVAGQEELRNYFAMELASEAMFDTDAGQLLRRQLLAQGSPTASSALADGFAGLPYIQAYKLEFLPEGAPAPTLPESKEVDAVFATE